MVKTLPASARDVEDTGSIPGFGRTPGVRSGSPLLFAWEILWTEDPGGLQSMGLQRVGHNRATEHHNGKESEAVHLKLSQYYKSTVVEFFKVTSTHCHSLAN